MLFERYEKVVVRTVLPVLRPLGWKEKMFHILFRVIPKERCVVEPPVFFDVLGVAAALFFSDAVVVFA